MLDDFAAFRIPYRKAGQTKGIKILCLLIAGGHDKIISEGKETILRKLHNRHFAQAGGGFSFKVG